MTEEVAVKSPLITCTVKVVKELVGNEKLHCVEVEGELATVSVAVPLSSAYVMDVAAAVGDTVTVALLPPMVPDVLTWMLGIVTVTRFVADALLFMTDTV